jgi:hypothetical protein
MVFAKFYKLLQLPGIYPEATFETYGSSKIKFVPTQPAQLLPGDIATFTYDGYNESRRVLIVATEIATNGKKTSLKGNHLLSCYLIDETLPKLVMMFNSFYKNRRSHYSRMPKTLRSVFGKGNYRTFNFSKISDLYELEVDVKGKNE